MLRSWIVVRARKHGSKIYPAVDVFPQTVTTNRGRPVADIVPSRTTERLNTKAAIGNILAAKKHPVTDETLVELKQAGRK